MVSFNVFWVCVTMVDPFREIVEDVRYLLNREYPRERVVNFVGDRYSLSVNDRNLLRRAVYSQSEIETTKKRLVPIEAINGMFLTVDGYCVLITVESALANRPIFLCDDGVVRDISGVFGKYKQTKKTDEVLELFLKTIKVFSPKKIHIYYDSPVSKSGELAAKTRTMLEKYGLRGEAKAVKSPDFEVLKGEIVATSDFPVIKKAKKVVDIAGFIAKKIGAKIKKMP